MDRQEWANNPDKMPMLLLSWHRLSTLDQCFLMAFSHAEIMQIPKEIDML